MTGKDILLYQTAENVYAQLPHFISRRGGGGGGGGAG